MNRQVTNALHVDALIMAESPSFEISGKIAADIERIAQEARDLSTRAGAAEGVSREHVKEAIKFFSPAAQAKKRDDDDSPLPAYLKTETPEFRIEVEKVLTLALRDGVEAGIEEARKRGGFFLDAFHDSLTDKIYPELMRRGAVPG